MPAANKRQASRVKKEKVKKEEEEEDDKNDVVADVSNGNQDSIKAEVKDEENSDDAAEADTKIESAKKGEHEDDNVDIPTAKIEESEDEQPDNKKKPKKRVSTAKKP